jgi:protein O-mannosyl-transferase
LIVAKDTQIYSKLAQQKSPSKSTPKLHAPPSKLPPWTPQLALGALAFAVYANSLASGFITDDQFQILNNPVVTGAQSLGSAFGSGVWAFLGYRGNYFRPLQFMIYGLMYRVFGPNAFAFHLLMVALHAVNTALVYSLARRLLSWRVRAAWVAAALFALHPIHTEAVNWIAALPDVLVTTFALAGLLAFAAQEAAPNPRQTLAHCAIYFAALLTKETGVMLLPLYAAFQWLRGARRSWTMYSGLLGVFVVYLAMRIHALGGLAPAQQTFFQLTGMEFAMSAAVLLAHYFAVLVWPLDLNFFHVFHATTSASWELIVSLAALSLIAWAAALRFASRDRVAVFAVFWIAASIAPALNIAGVGQNVFAERYLYLPSVGFAILAGLFWAWLAGARSSWAWPAAAAILLVFSVETIARNRDWKDDFTLLQVTLRQSPGSGYLHNLMAGAWVQRDQFQHALEEERLATRFEPRSAVFHKNLGNILLGMDPADASREFLAAIAIQPGSAELHDDLGLAYKAMGEGSKAAEESARAAAIEKGK